MTADGMEVGRDLDAQAAQADDRNGRRAIVIVGMHRSGTSAIAGLLRQLGCDIPGELIPPAFDNPKGFFENRRFVAFDDMLLERIDSAYDEAVNIDRARLDGARDRGAVDELAALLAEELGTARFVVVKDPRICRLLPIWTEALERQGRAVLTIHPLRHPLEVAQSLAKRNEFPIAQSLLLWLDHVLSAERDSRGGRRSFLMFDDVMRDWRDTARKIAGDLDVVWPVSYERASVGVETFLSGDLRHHASGDDAFGSQDPLEALVARAWTALKALIADGSNLDAMNELDAVRAEIGAGEALFSGYVVGSHRLLAQRFDRIDALEGHAAHMDHVAESARRTIEAARLEKAALHEEKSALEESVERSTSRNRALEHDLEVMINDRDTLARHLGTMRQEYHDLEVVLHTLRAQFQSLLGSVSWRMGAPIRAIGRALPAGFRQAVRQFLRSVYGRLRGGFDGQQEVSATAEPVAPIDPAADHASLEPAVAKVPAMSKPSARRAPPEQLRQAEIVKASRYFDPEFYAGRDEAKASGLDPALHYVLSGEAAGHVASKRFDPKFYARMYPDLAAAVPNLLVHFTMHGASEGRRGVPATSDLRFTAGTLDPDRRTVLVIAHEASRTGAPILAWNLVHKLRERYNVVALLMAGGEFEPVFARDADILVGPVGRPACFDPIEAEYVAEAILDRVAIDFVVANSVETRNFAAQLSRRGVPVVALVHEFSTYYRPPGLLHELYESAARIVFPAAVVRDVSRLEYEVMRGRDCEILPQGPSIVPTLVAPGTRAAVNHPNLRRILRPDGFEDACLVLGMGTVQHRKGVDLFVAAALAARQAAPDAKFRFLWIGHGYKPEEDLQYSVYLKAQIELSGLGDCLDIIENVADLDPVYAEMDALLLTSRLDPLPNVSIDAALRGIPVICFAGASGMADILAGNAETQRLVVPHLDSGAAGRVLADLAADADLRERTGTALLGLARKTFDIDAYVRQIGELGEAAVADAARIEADRALIEARPDGFDDAFYKGEVRPGFDRTAALNHYLTQASHRTPGVPPAPYAYPRRPLPGFNPLRFEEEHARQGRLERGSALARFLAAERPAGPWTHEVIRAGDPLPAPASEAPRVAVHGHFHYPELLPDFLDRLGANRLACDLYLTSDTPAGVAALEEGTRGFAKGRVTVRRVPNAGRDIGPFLTAFGRETFAPYDVVGHLHGKRSLHTRSVDATYGERWREFLWEHLLGARFPMADAIVARFAAESDLGLVFPEDPNLVGWDGSGAAAEALARRMGLALPLPYAFDFPNGTMFWARPAALAPLFDLNLDWSDYPAEPLPKDGTLLHAVERLAPFAAEKAGYRFATTLVPGVVR